MRRFFLWMVGLWGLGLFACSGPDKAPESGEDPRLLKEAPYSGLTDSLRTEPKNGDLYLRRALLLTRHNQHELARSDYAQAWSLQPSVEAALAYASNLSILDRMEDRTQLLLQAIGRFPEVAVLGRKLGEAYRDIHQPQKALDQYDQLLTKDSMDVESWYEKGLVLSEMKDTAGALRALSKAYRLQPVIAYGMDLAHLMAECRNPQALLICDQILAGDAEKNLAEPFFIKGIYFSNTGQNRRAIQAFDSCITREWTYVDAYLEKGILLFKSGMTDSALLSFELAARVSNTDADAYFWMGRCYEKKQQLQDALDSYERAAALDKHFEEARAAIRRLRERAASGGGK